jgi:hypothetical protein
VAEKILRAGDFLPHLGQKVARRKASRSTTPSQPVAETRQIPGAVIVQRHGGGHRENFNLNVGDFRWADLVEALILHGSRGGKFVHILHEGLIGFQSANAAAQFALLCQGDKRSTPFA